MLENGMVREEGTHRMLMKQQGIYADMYKKQAENYLAVSSSEIDRGIFACGPNSQAMERHGFCYEKSVK